MYREKKKSTGKSNVSSGRKGVSFAKKGTLPVQRVEIGNFGGQELNTDDTKSIWRYFNTIKTEEKAFELINAIDNEGDYELADELEAAWYAYDKYDDFAEDYMSSYERGQMKSQKPTRSNKNGFKKVVRDIEKRKAKIGNAKKTISSAKVQGKQAAEMYKPKAIPPKKIRGLTNKEIDGYRVLSNGFNSTDSRAETDFELTSEGKVVSKPMKVHLSIQRHYFPNMDTGAAKELNSLMTPSISRGDILTDMANVTKAVAQLWMAKKPIIPKRIQVKVPSGRTYEVDGLTIGEAHAYVIGGPNVVSLTRNQFVALKAIKDASNDGYAPEALGIIQRHLPTSKERVQLYKLAATRFGIKRSELLAIDPDSDSRPKKSDGKKKGGSADLPI